MMLFYFYLTLIFKKHKETNNKFNRNQMISEFHILDYYKKLSVDVHRRTN